MKTTAKEYIEQCPANSHALWMYKGALTYVQDIPLQDREILFKHKIYNTSLHDLEKEQNEYQK